MNKGTTSTPQEVAENTVLTNEIEGTGEDLSSKPGMQSNSCNSGPKPVKLAKKKVIKKPNHANKPKQTKCATVKQPKDPNKAIKKTKVKKNLPKKNDKTKKEKKIHPYRGRMLHYF